MTNDELKDYNAVENELALAKESLAILHKFYQGRVSILSRRLSTTVSELNYRRNSE